MNSIRYRVVNPFGLHARASVFIVAIANACAKDWEVVIATRGSEGDAKSIMSVMMVAAGYGTEIEFLSLMPDQNWAQFTASLECLFYVTDHEGDKVHAYQPVERIIKLASKEDFPPCMAIQRALQSRSAHYNCGPFFERIDDDAAADDSPSRQPTVRAPFDFECIDTFISYDSRDFGYATRIYDALIDRGIKVFFAGVSLPRTGTTDFQLAIEKALANTRSMILIATDPAHLDGGWVRAEWTTFLNEQRVGRKPGNLVIVRPEKVSLAELPVMLRMFQSEAFPEYGPSSAERIDRLVEFLNIAVRPRVR